MSGLRSTRAQAAFKETLHRIKSKSEGEFFEEWNSDEKKILESPFGGLFSPKQVQAPPALVPSPKEENQKKLWYQERVRKGLSLFLATSPASREFDAGGTESASIFLALLNKIALPRRKTWNRLKRQAVEAASYLITIRATDWPEEVTRHITSSQAAKGASKDYSVFLWLVSLIGMAGTYRCRRPGLAPTDRRRATIQSRPEFLANPFFKEEPLSNEQLTQRTESEIDEVEAAGRADERFALNLLPVLFYIDRHFFLQQPWVIKLLADWHENGEEVYMQHAFFGTRKDKRSLSYGALLDEIARDAKSVSAIKGLMLTNGGQLNEALKELGEDTASNPRKGKSWMVLGKNNPKGVSTARTAYYRDRQGFDKRLVDRFKR